MAQNKTIQIKPKQQTAAQQQALQQKQQQAQAEEQKRKEKERRYQAFAGDWCRNNTYDFTPTKEFCQHMQSAFRHYSAVMLKVNEQTYNDVITKTVWNFYNFDLIMQVMSTVSAYQLGMTMDEYMQYKEFLAPIAKSFNEAFQDAQTSTIRKEFDEHENIIDKEEPPTAMITADA